MLTMPYDIIVSRTFYVVLLYYILSSSPISKIKKKGIETQNKIKKKKKKIE